ncbi:LysE family transporter [Arthrobacter sp. 35W]|uniref:LysE family transporter n=1 Tax=Arthrobacter sp. 35W TaxID=1132441 RepID=UPI0004025419|nr:LysE family transporter [Arthrobacter sp. 35W]
MTLSASLLAGLAAGLGVALPLGAVGILIVTQGVAGGFRSGAAAAGGVALVDLVYCVAALAFGAALAPAVAAAGRWPGAAAGVLLIALAVRGLAKLRSADGAAAPAVRGGPVRVFATFTGLTALNPATVLYFLALATVLGAGGWTWGSAAAFAIGVGTASLGWQLVLAGTGSLAGRWITVRGRRWLGIAGYGMVTLMGLAALAVAASG